MICFNWLNAVRYLWPRGPSLGLSVCGLVLHNERTNERRLSNGLLQASSSSPFLRLSLPPSLSRLVFSSPFSSSTPSLLSLSLSSSSPQVLRGLVPSAPDLFDYLEIGRSFIRRASRERERERVKSRFSSEEKPRAIHKYRATTSGSLLPRMIYKRLLAPALSSTLSTRTTLSLRLSKHSVYYI